MELPSASEWCFYITYTTYSGLMKTALNNVLLPTLFNVGSNTEQVVEPELACKSGVTMLNNIVDNLEQYGQQNIVQCYFHQAGTGCSFFAVCAMFSLTQVSGVVLNVAVLHNLLQFFLVVALANVAHVNRHHLASADQHAYNRVAPVVPSAYDYRHDFLLERFQRKLKLHSTIVALRILVTHENHD